MRVIEAPAEARATWNEFVGKNYPPIGAFMQTWEWGQFQQALGRPTRRYWVVDKDSSPVAIFTLVHHALPLPGWQYGYIPRGPVIETSYRENDEAMREIFAAIHAWAREALGKMVFVRLEPPIHSLRSFAAPGLALPDYYVQPRYNLAVPLGKTEEEIAAAFHPSTRSNLARAVRRGVTVKMRSGMDQPEYEQFTGMVRDTIERNSGKNAYPGGLYFEHFLKTFLRADMPDRYTPALNVFYGYRNGQPAGTHAVMYFGSTATYLYGASYSDHLGSKVTTLLHWEAMREANRRGYAYYDLGGIDEKRWPSLTVFKRQFRGREFEYGGNLDVVLSPWRYKLYHLARLAKKILRQD